MQNSAADLPATVSWSNQRQSEASKSWNAYWSVTWNILHMGDNMEENGTHLWPQSKIRMSGVGWRYTLETWQGRTPSGPLGKSRSIMHQEREIWRRNWYAILEGSSFLWMEGPGKNWEYSFILIKDSVADLLNLEKKKHSSPQNSCPSESCVQEVITDMMT